MSHSENMEKSGHWRVSGESQQRLVLFYLTKSPSPRFRFVKRSQR